MSIEIVPVWKQVDAGLNAELFAFWKDNGAIGNEDEATRRGQQAVCIARDGDGKLCGVATAVVKVLPRLRQPMYYYRMFFAKSLRGHQQFVPFYRRCKQVLQEYNAGLPQPESLGILIELENRKIGMAYQHAYDKTFDAAFIGYSVRGLKLYVSYFEDAKLRAPVPVNMKNAPNATSNKAVNAV